MQKNGLKNKLTLIIYLVIIPFAVIGGAVFLGQRFYAYLSLLVAIFTLLPLFWTFEKRDTNSGELMLLAVTVALSTVGRIIFAGIPAFKPVTALTVIVAVYLGREAGFIVGSMSAVISNFYFGQGPWTPFQMLGWGLIGLLAGLLSKPLIKSKILLLIFGILSGFLYSAVTDIMTVMTVGGFDLNRYLAAAITALPTSVTYAVSNFIFLLILSKPIGSILLRIKKKYGLFGIKP